MPTDQGRTNGPALFSLSLDGGPDRAGGGAAGDLVVPRTGRRFGRGWLVWGLLFLITGLGALLGLRQASLLETGALEIVLEPSGRVVHRLPAAAGDRFEIRFLHSVEQSEVIEYFRIEPDGSLVLEGTLYHSQGVGLPFDEPAQFSITPEGMRWENMNRAIPQLRLRTRESTEHQLRKGDQIIHLSSQRLAGRPLLIRVSTGRME